MTLVPANFTTVAQMHSDELDTLRRTIGHDLDPTEFELFAAICRRTGLDPFARQIYAVKRYDSRQRKDVMQIQTGIDGLRLIAERSQHYAGQTPAEWCGQDGKWVDVWLAEGPPAAARVGVIRDDFREPVYAVAKFSSYCAITKDGQPMAMWRTMPEVMIAKCAEALAIRKAFPNDVSGVYTREEMAQQHNADGPPLASPEQVARIDVLLPQVPQDAMPDLKAWKAEQGISMKPGEFTADAADMVIAKLEQLATHSLPVEEPTTPTASAHGAGDGDDKGTDDGTLTSVGASLTVPEDESTLKATNEAAYTKLNRYCRKVAADHFDPDKDTKAAQWEALAYACSAGRTVHLGELTPDEASDFRRRCQDVANGLARWVESDRPEHLGWTFDLTALDKEEVA
jgi:phage recombination protein Bet